MQVSFINSNVRNTRSSLQQKPQTNIFRLITTMHYPSLFLAAFAGLATANIDLSPQPSMLNAGDVRNVSWTIDRPYVSCPHHWSLVSH